MRLLLYLNGNNGTAQRLRDAIKGLIPDNRTEIYWDIATLTRRLRQSTGDLTVAILCASTREHLHELLGLGRWLNDLKIILVLPDSDSNTISQGHTLMPRFLSFTDSNFSDVSAVLEKMLKVYGNEHPEY
jgi:hypothetical protein